MDCKYRKKEEVDKIMKMKQTFALLCAGAMVITGSAFPVNVQAVSYTHLMAAVESIVNGDDLSTTTGNVASGALKGSVSGAAGTAASEATMAALAAAPIPLAAKVVIGIGAGMFAGSVASDVISDVCDGVGDIVSGIVAVSYTHLDVYKRQVQYCPNCGASVSEEQSGKNENSYQESNADGSLWESLVEFFKALIEYMKEAGLHIIDAIDKIIQMPPNIPKDSICPYCNSEDTFPIVKNETEIKTKGYSMGRGCCGMCLLGPFGLLCGALFTGSKVKSRSITWWGCKNCGRQHLAQHDAVEMLSSLMDKMTVNCLCYGALGSLLLYPILDELVHGFLRTVIVVLIAVIVGVSLPLYFCYQLCEDIDKQLGYSIWDILEVEKKQEIWSCIKFSMLSLAGTLIFVCPILVHFAE